MPCMGLICVLLFVARFALVCYLNTAQTQSNTHIHMLFVCTGVSVCLCFVFYNVRAYAYVGLNVYKYKIMLIIINLFLCVKLNAEICIVKLIFYITNLIYTIMTKKISNERASKAIRMHSLSNADQEHCDNVFQSDSGGCCESY